MKNYCWGIALEPDLNNRLAGIFWFTKELPDYFSGNTTALFRTQAMARAYLPRIKGPKFEGKFPRARVVKVYGLLHFLPRPVAPIQRE